MMPATLDGMDEVRLAALSLLPLMRPLGVVVRLADEIDVRRGVVRANDIDERIQGQHAIRAAERDPGLLA